MPVRDKILDPSVLARIANLSFKARNLADGVLSGLHKSRHMGVSVEFASHKEYSPGDEIRHLDWKVFAKSDKYYVKRYEEETNRKATILFDASGSMGYGSEDSRKVDVGATLAAAISYMLLAQGDAVGLVVFGEKDRTYIPPRSKSEHLQAILTGLAEAEPAGETSISEMLGRMAERLSGRGMLILISDLLEDPEAVRRMLRLHGSRKQEIIVFQTLDSAEIEFPFRDLTLFKGMEQPLEALAEPEVIAVEYRRLIAEFIESYRVGLAAEGMDYQLVNTSEPLEQTLFNFLARRNTGRRRAAPGT